VHMRFERHQFVTFHWQKVSKMKVMPGQTE
jgi:hypothetical protein